MHVNRSITKYYFKYFFVICFLQFEYFPFFNLYDKLKLRRTSIIKKISIPFSTELIKPEFTLNANNQGITVKKYNRSSKFIELHNT